MKFEVYYKVTHKVTWKEKTASSKIIDTIDKKSAENIVREWLKENFSSDYYRFGISLSVELQLV